MNEMESSGTVQASVDDTIQKEQTNNDHSVEYTSQIRPCGFRMDSGIYKLPKTKQSLMARLSRSFSTKSGKYRL